MTECPVFKLSGRAKIRIVDPYPTVVDLATGQKFKLSASQALGVPMNAKVNDEFYVEVYSDGTVRFVKE